LGGVVGFGGGGWGDLGVWRFVDAAGPGTLGGGKGGFMTAPTEGGPPAAGTGPGGRGPRTPAAMAAIKGGRRKGPPPAPHPHLLHVTEGVHVFDLHFGPKLGLALGAHAHLRAAAGRGARRGARGLACCGRAIWAGGASRGGGRDLTGNDPFWRGGRGRALGTGTTAARHPAQPSPPNSHRDARTPPPRSLPPRQTCPAPNVPPQPPPHVDVASHGPLRHVAVADAQEPHHAAQLRAVQRRVAPTAHVRLGHDLEQGDALGLIGGGVLVF
jgi:hypothetical protein